MLWRREKLIFSMLAIEPIFLGRPARSVAAIPTKQSPHSSVVKSVSAFPYLLLIKLFHIANFFSEKHSYQNCLHTKHSQ
jgi:hypothetical protein